VSPSAAVATATVIEALPVGPPRPAVPALEEAGEAGDRSAPVFDLVLRRPRQMDRLLRDEARLPRAIQDLVGLSCVGLAVHGLVVGASAQVAGAGVFFAHGMPALWMPAAFVLAFLGALGICLPSFYFFTQLSGLDASFRLVTAQAVRGTAKTAVLLLGALPFYAAWLLGNVVGVFSNVELTLTVGMVLPFVVGLWGIAEVDRGFRGMLDTLPVTHARRGNFIRRMVLAWGALYTVIAPVALVRLCEWLGGGR
jgi:hypothetical protein